MSRFSRFVTAVVLGGAGVLLTPAPAPAQIYGGFGRQFMGSPGFYPFAMNPIGVSRPFGLQPLQSMPSLPALPSLRPLSSFPFGGSGYNYIAAGAGYAFGGYGGDGRDVGQDPAAQIGLYGYPTPGYSGYSGLDPNQQRFYREQVAAGAYNWDRASSEILGQRAYEAQAPASGPVANNAQTDPLQRALTARTGSEVASGEALNQILTAIQGAEGKGKGGKAPPSAFLAPNLMEQVRFGGSPAGEALNLLRSAGKLEFPAAFETDSLRDTRDALDRDFAAAAAPVLAGKPVDPFKLAKLSATVKVAQQKLAPAIKDLPLNEAIAARRLLNQLEAVVKALREAGSSTLVNPKWSTEGTNVADLVKHMTKHKLRFGPADRGNEEAYLALHQALATYLFALTQAQAKK